MCLCNLRAVLESEDEPPTKPGPIVNAKITQKSVGGISTKPIVRYVPYIINIEININVNNVRQFKLVQ